MPVLAPAGQTETFTPIDVFTDPIVQLAALCPLCALAALKPEAALAAVSPALRIFNPAINPRAALLAQRLAVGTATLAHKVAVPAQRAGLAQVQLRARLQQLLPTRV